MLSYSRLQPPLNTPAARRKVLIVAPFPPRRDGFHGGSQVMGRLIEELAESQSVAVAYLRSEGELPMEEELARRCAAVEEVPRPGAPGELGRSIRLLKALMRGDPMWVEDWRVPAFRVRLRQLVERWRPDVTQFESNTVAQYIDEARGSIAILETQEPGAAAAKDRWQFSHGWRRPILARDMRAWEAYEREILGKFAAVVCFTDLDRRNLLELQPGARVNVIPPRGPSMTASRSQDKEGGTTILFAANFIHPPNVDAAIWLAEEIFPQVRTRHPDAVLQLVGAGPPASVRRLAGPGVAVTGSVPDVTPFLEAATVVVAPLRIGGGIRIKMMDALVFGKPTVGTRRAAEGLNVADRRELLLADESGTFADAVSALLGDRPLREVLSANAQVWAAQFGRAGRVGAAYEQLYESLAGTNSNGSNDP